MMVCPCEEITDEQVRNLVRNGATRMEHIVAACSAGAYCGACIPAILQILRHEKHMMQRSEKRVRPISKRPY
jgi:nitrite reductase (NADH) large subunit